MLLPKKKSKKKPLTKEDKKQNQRISSMRITIENIIREEKIFRIIAEKYLNRCPLLLNIGFKIKIEKPFKTVKQDNSHKKRHIVSKKYRR